MGSRAAAHFAFMLDVEFTELSDPGKVRGHNEDFLGHSSPVTPVQVNTHGWIFALADGVGGNDYGEVASRTAVETVLSGFRAAPAGEPPGSLLARLVKSANSRIVEIGMSNASSGRKMATTLVACALRFDRLAVAHVGDSRCYLVRRGHTTALTRDHTLVAEQVRLGVLSAREASESSSKHLLSRSLGSELFVNVETSEHQIHVGDVLLLCSDGLHGSLEPSEIADLVGQISDLRIAAQKMVAIANDRDGSDNISVQLIRIRGVERVGMYRGRPYKLR